MTTISIGILAYNEENGIAQTIESVLGQQLQRDSSDNAQPDIRAELVVVPNGCSDRTAQIARDAISSRGDIGEGPGFFDARVCEIEQAGKENAWNRFTNELSAQDADMLILMDADVRLEHDRVIYDLVKTLCEHPECLIAAGIPVKHIQLKRRKSIADRVSLNASSLRQGMKGIFAGCLYCGRADHLRNLFLPTVLMGEDAFLRALTVTREFTHKDDPSLIVRAETARVIFESYTNPREIIRNKTRRMLELTINAIIFSKLWEESTPECPAGQLMKRWQAEDPQWSQKLVDETFRARGFWAVQPHRVYKQFLQLKLHGWRRRLKLLPAAIATLPLNLICVYLANRRIARGEIRNLWDKPDAALKHQ